MKQALIIQGTSGSGKTTVAQTIAAESRSVYLGHDFFLFTMQPYKPETAEHFILGNSHLWTCFNNAIEAGKNIVLEGALATFDEEINTFNLDDYIEQLEKNEYKVTRVALECSYEEANKRMINRFSDDEHAIPVPSDIYSQIKVAIEKSLTPLVYRVNTEALTKEQVVQEVRKVFAS